MQKEEIQQLKDTIKHMEESLFIKIIVERKQGIHTEWTEDFYVRPTDMVSTVVEKVKFKRGKRGPSWVLMKPNGNSSLDNNRSFESNGIWTNTLLRLRKFEW